MAEAMHRMTLAIPASLKPSLDRLAQVERRSVSAQIIKMLEGAIASDGTKLLASAGGGPGVGRAIEA